MYSEQNSPARRKMVPKKSEISGYDAHLGRGKAGAEGCVHHLAPVPLWLRRDARMASNYTTNYGLCQWESGDQFIRSEFNQDNQKIDTALKRVADTAAADLQAVRVQFQSAAQTAQSTAEQALDALVPVAYNVYNLALRQELEGKATGWKQALLFDGFRDKAGIDTMSEALVLSGGGVVLSKSLSGTQEVANGTSYQYSTSSLSTAEAVTAPGGAYLTRIKCVWKAESSYQVGEQSLSFGFYVNGTLHHSERHSLYFNTVQQEGYVDLTTRVPVAAGDSVHFTCSSLGTHYKMPIVRDSNQRIYAGYVFQGTNATTGTVRTKGVSLPSASGVRAWVRHTGGSVALTFYNGGNIRKMTHVGTRSTVDSNGNACTEEEFQLTSDQIAAADSLLFTLSLGSNERVELLDYGVVLL